MFPAVSEMWSLKPKTYLNLWGDALRLPAAEPRMAASATCWICITDAPKLPRNTAKSSQKKWGLGILFIDATCSTSQLIAVAAYWTKEPRAVCLCYSYFWWKHMLIYLFTEKRGTGKGHQLTSQHGSQYGSQFACSSTCYLLKARRHSAWSNMHPVSPCGKCSFLKIVLWLCLLTPFCVHFRGALQQICFLWGSLLKILDWNLLKKPRGYHMCKKEAEQKHTLPGFPATHTTVPKRQHWSAAPLLWPDKSPSSRCVLRNRSTTSSCSQCQQLHWKQSMEWSESLGFF